jgi:hypothetical protein
VAEVLPDRYRAGTLAVVEVLPGPVALAAVLLPIPMGRRLRHLEGTYEKAGTWPASCNSLFYWSG